MRALTQEEIFKIAGGRIATRAAVTLSGVTVTGTPPGSGTFGGGGGGGSIPPGGGAGNPTQTSLSPEELIKGLAQELQAAVLDGEIPSDYVESGVNVVTLTAGALNDNYLAGENSWEIYHTSGFSPNPSGYVNTPIEWENVDWAAFASGAPTYQQALIDMYNHYYNPH